MLSMEIPACAGCGRLLRKKFNDTLPAVTAGIDFHVFLNHADSSNSISGDAHEITACQVICGCHTDVALRQQGGRLQLLKSCMEGSDGPLPVPAHYNSGLQLWVKGLKGVGQHSC